MAECPTCGDEFDGKHGMRVHHSLQHGESIAFEKVECWNCGCTYEKRKSEMTDGERNFCGDECYIEWVENEQDSEDHPSWNGGKTTTCCKWCGSTIKIRNHRLKNHKNNFCSHSCRGKWHSENFSGENHPLYQSVTVECENCGDVTEKVPANVENYNTHFCSKECKYEYSVGEKHPRWRGGCKRYYGSTWKSQRRKAIKRDDEKCQDCGLTRNQHYRKHGQDLEVHHQTPLIEFEDTEKANKLSNLVTVCTNCHPKREHS